MATIERKRAAARQRVEAPKLAHAFCPCQDDVPDAEARPICDTKQGHAGDAPPEADRCVVCLDLINRRDRWCVHG